MAEAAAKAADKADVAEKMVDAILTEAAATVSRARTRPVAIKARIDMLDSHTNPPQISLKRRHDIDQIGSILAKAADDVTKIVESGDYDVGRGVAFLDQLLHAAQIARDAITLPSAMKAIADATAAAPARV